jgi:hypothetical protein
VGGWYGALEGAADTLDPEEPRPPDLADPMASQPMEWDERVPRPRGGRDLVPSADPSGRPRGRHEAPRRLALPGGLATMAAMAAVVLIGGLLATRLIGSAKQAPDPPATTTAAPAREVARPRGCRAPRRSATSSTTGASSRT